MVHMCASLAALLLVAPGGALAQSQILGPPSSADPASTQWTDKRPVLTAASLVFGAYDPHGDFTAERHVSTEHLFLPWEDVELASLSDADEYARSRGRNLMISVEPWSWDKDSRLTGTDLLANIRANRYAANMAGICQAAARLQSEVTFRWGQEMEDPDSRFVWAGWDPADYRMAYRQFVTQCREHIDNASYMWSPKGMAGLEAYYPGDDVVDSVGLSIFGFEPYDVANFGRPRSFAEVLQPAYARVVGFDKPIYVAELGYEGSLQYVTHWADDVATPDAAFPELVGVVYFNDREVYPWPDGFGLPNWRVASDVVN
ncbi:MAG: beta-mannosidase [Salinarimonadaceae bacterium]|nr:MAG: beta-mannosidase [Salinarimonadaceae bacterium]